MKTFAILFVFLSGVTSFQPLLQSARIMTSLNGYIPSGFTEESYKKFKEAEKKKQQKKKYLMDGQINEKTTEKIPM